MAVPGWPSPAFWMASIARVRRVSVARRSRSAPRAVVVVTVAPRAGRVVAGPNPRLPALAPRIPDARSSGAGSFGGARLDPAAQRRLPQHPLGGDRPLVLAGPAGQPGAVGLQRPRLLVVGQHGVEHLLQPAGQVGVGYRRDHLDPQVEV